MAATGVYIITGRHDDIRYTSLSKIRDPQLVNTVKPVHTGTPWGQSFIPVWTGFGLDRVLAFGEEQTSLTCTIDIQRDVSPVGLK